VILFGAAGTSSYWLCRPSSSSHFTLSLMSSFLFFVLATLAYFIFLWFVRGRSVGIVRLRSKRHGVLFIVFGWLRVDQSDLFLASFLLSRMCAGIDMSYYSDDDSIDFDILADSSVMRSSKCKKVISTYRLSVCIAMLIVFFSSSIQLQLSHSRTSIGSQVHNASFLTFLPEKSFP
jgi:hypothetical protein